ncbi:MAG: Uma2 family endonuclease [Phormidesmis sp.]
MTVVAAKWTLEEYHRMIDAGVLDNRRVELIRGEIIEMAPEGKPHAYFSSASGNYLVRMLGEQAMVRQAKPITLPDQSEPEPDVAIVRPLGEEYLSHHPYPEDIFWVIEYSNATLKKDLGLKAQVYAAVAIPEYWVVNLKNRSVIVFREPKGGQYTSRTDYTESRITESSVTESSIQPLAFPSLSIPVSSLVKPL